MFEKMTSRERNLVYAISALLPIALVFIGFYLFMERYNANDAKTTALGFNIQEETDRQDAALAANKRRVYYNGVSLPPNIRTSSNEYASWLKFLLTELQIEYKSVTPREKGDLTFKRKRVGNLRTFSVNATTDLDQLTEFLNRFYTVDLLHRVNSLKIIPKNEIVGGKEQKIRSGKLSVSMEIEVLALTTAEENREFTKQFRELARTKEEYKEIILRRDIFGEANNTPVVDARPQPKYLTDEKISVNITATDADEENVLSFELIDPPIKEAALKFSEGDRRAVLSLPGQKPGRYKFKVKATDNGLPVKENFKEFTVVVTDPTPEEPVAEVIPDPPFIHATQAVVSGIAKDTGGDFRVWITVRTKGDRYKLKVGESFKLDEKDWLVDSIDPKKKTAVLRVGEEKLLTYTLDTFLSEPTNEVKLDPPATKPDSKAENGSSDASETAQPGNETTDESIVSQ